MKKPKVPSSWLENWGGILFTLLGLFMTWEVAAIVGLAFAVVGLISGWSSSNRINNHDCCLR